jgi:hypothetical protein
MRQQELYPLAKGNVGHAVRVACVRILKWVSFLSTNSTENYKWDIANVPCFSNKNTSFSYMNKVQFFPLWTEQYCFVTDKYKLGTVGSMESSCSYGVRKAEG